MKIAICGSINSSDQLIKAAEHLEEKGHQVFLPYYTGKIRLGKVDLKEYVKTKEKLGGDISLREAVEADFFKRYFELIGRSDCVLVINVEKNGQPNYIGGNTLIEMAFAYVLDKNIFLLNPIPENKYYKDEIIDMKPIILNGDLSKIK